MIPTAVILNWLIESLVDCRQQLEAHLAALGTAQQLLEAHRAGGGIDAARLGVALEEAEQLESLCVAGFGRIVTRRAELAPGTSPQPACSARNVDRYFRGCSFVLNRKLVHLYRRNRNPRN